MIPLFNIFNVFHMSLNISFKLTYKSSPRDMSCLHDNRVCTFVSQGVFVFFGGEPGLTDEGHLRVLTRGGGVLVLLKDLHTRMKYRQGQDDLFFIHAAAGECTAEKRAPGSERPAPDRGRRLSSPSSSPRNPPRPPTLKVSRKEVSLFFVSVTTAQGKDLGKKAASHSAASPWRTEAPPSLRARLQRGAVSSGAAQSSHLPLINSINYQRDD